MSVLGAFQPTWLCPTPADRARVVDMERRLRPLRNFTLGILALTLVATGPWVGWWTLVPLAAVSVGFLVGGHRVGESPRPEYAIALAWCLSEVVIGVSVGLSGGPASPGLAWLALPVVTLPARFPLRGVFAGVAVAVSVLLAACFGVNADAVLDNPSALIFTLALIVSVACLSMALMRSEIDHRSEAVIDPLTSMLNRNALAGRVTELTQQAKVNGQPVALVVADVDSFKAINDEHGHSLGDAVLREVAYRIRSQLRAYDLAYRLGGEEFLVLLPGADAAAATEIAEQLRSAVDSATFAGLSLTLSLGVSASRPGGFDYGTVFAAADQALYLAKAAGRNCVRVAGSHHQPAAALAFG